MTSNSATNRFGQRGLSTPVSAMALCLALTAVGWVLFEVSGRSLPAFNEMMAFSMEGRMAGPEGQAVPGNVASLSAADPRSEPRPEPSCSGGSDGGIDATGNQCSDPGSAVSYTPTVAPIGNVQRGEVAAAVSSTPLIDTTPDSPTVAPAEQLANAPDSPHALDAGANMAAGNAPGCSGGADGGIDATGNQCSESAPIITTGPFHLAKSSVRGQGKE